MRRVLISLSAILFALATGLTVYWCQVIRVPENHVRVGDIQAKYPFVSLAPRLEYERERIREMPVIPYGEGEHKAMDNLNGQLFWSNPLLSVNQQKMKDDFRSFKFFYLRHDNPAKDVNYEVQAYKDPREIYGSPSRHWSLYQMHRRNASEFIAVDGVFGVGRNTRMWSVAFLDLPEAEPVRPSDRLIYPNEEIDLPTHNNSAANPLVLPALGHARRYHHESIASFVSMEFNGLNEDVFQVAKKKYEEEIMPTFKKGGIYQNIYQSYVNYNNYTHHNPLGEYADVIREDNPTNPSRRFAGFHSHHFRNRLELQVKHQHDPAYEGSVYHVPSGSGNAAARDSSTWEVARLELVSLLKFDTPRVYQSEFLPRMQDFLSDDVPTRGLTDFEEAGLKKFYDGEELHLRASVNHIRMVGALRAVKECTRCHHAAEGDLLGAFSYDLIRKP